YSSSMEGAKGFLFLPDPPTAPPTTGGCPQSQSQTGSRFQRGVPAVLSQGHDCKTRDEELAHEPAPTSDALRSEGVRPRERNSSNHARNRSWRVSGREGCRSNDERKRATIRAGMDLLS